MQGIQERLHILRRTFKIFEEETQMLKMADIMMTHCDDYIREQGRKMMVNRSHRQACARRMMEKHLIHSYGAAGSSFELPMHYYEEEFHCE